jgi:2-polyprenyl-3-methyl-5-hydroxy-6-metoxy-1,4-benzoquinol methylase
MKILDVGCGPNGKKPGSVGMDVRPAPHVDVVHNLDAYPYPFADNEFDGIEMSHVIEHVQRPLHMLNEIHRIAKPGAIVRVITPHYTSQLSYGDFEHFHHFGYITFLTLQNTKLFTIVKHKLHFTDVYKVLGIGLLANWLPRRWEKYFGFIFPALYVEVFLEVRKPEGSRGLVENYMY